MSNTTTQPTVARWAPPVPAATADEIAEAARIAQRWPDDVLVVLIGIAFALLVGVGFPAGYLLAYLTVR